MKEYTSKNKINPTTGEKCCVRARTVAVCSLQSAVCSFFASFMIPVEDMEIKNLLFLHCTVELLI